MTNFWGGFTKQAKMLGSMPNLFKGTKNMMTQPKIKQIKVPTPPSPKAVGGMSL